jgi:hypothetical protein
VTGGDLLTICCSQSTPRLRTKYFVSVEQVYQGGDGMADATLWNGHLVWGLLELCNIVEGNNAANSQQVRS